jgi:precorrin-2 dehydrogenase / sirohydrochlorin ferrochelatase
MFPIVLDLKKIPVLLVGKGEALERRRKQFEEYGAALTSPSTLAGEGWGEGCYFVRTGFINSTPLPNLPPQGGKGFSFHESIIMVCGLSYAESKQIANAARASGKLVNVEDMNDLCDFYFTANVKHGDLVIAVSTGGASPTLARRIRDYIAEKFGKEWENWVIEIADFRRKLKDSGKTTSQVLAASDEFLQEKGWLK